MCERQRPRTNVKAAPKSPLSPLAQTLAQTGFFTLWHSPSSVAPGRAGFFFRRHCPTSVAPLAQTGMLKDSGPSFPVAPGRAGQALFQRGALQSPPLLKGGPPPPATRLPAHVSPALRLLAMAGRCQRLVRSGATVPAPACRCLRQH